MMDVKRIRVLWIGLLLMLGVSHSAMGQMTTGITVRVDLPDSSGKVVGVGDSIVVTIKSVLLSMPDSVYVRVVQTYFPTDTTTARGAIDSTGVFGRDPKALILRFSKKGTQVSSSPVFRVSFVIKTGDSEKRSGLAVIATVFSKGVATQFHNLDRTLAVPVNPALGTVGLE